MKSKALALFAALFCMMITTAASAVEHVIASPNGRHEITFKLTNGTPAYHVKFEGKPILLDSQLSVTLNGKMLKDGFEILETTTDSKDSKWAPVVGSKSSYPDAYNQRIVKLRSTTDKNWDISLTFRAYNEGVAFRYSITNNSDDPKFEVTSENTGFQFTDDHFVYYDDYPQARYSKVRLSEMGRNSIRPLLVETSSNFLAIAEAGSMEAYVPMTLNRSGENRLVTGFRRGRVSAQGSLATPWRVIMAAKKPGTLVENHYLLQNLSPPSELKDTSWIKPGKVWRSALKTSAAKDIIDYAAANNYQYVHYDAGWYGPERSADSNPLTIIDPIDLKETIEYGRARGIGLICYINKIAMSRYDLDKTFRTYREWGLSGVKFGFVNWESQSDMEFLHMAIRKAAEHRLIVDIHDNFRLTGIERTYPHLLTVEGILGNEERASKGNTPENVLTTSFARMIAGAGDYTPCFLDGRVVSRSFQLALGVVFYSPLQYLHWYDQIEKYAGRSFPELEFWKEMPTTWDDSKVIHGVIGDHMTVARRKGKSWFVGTIVNDARELKFPMNFLGDGEYIARIYKESPGNKKEVSIESIEIDSSSTIIASMSSGSGHAIWIRPKP